MLQIPLYKDPSDPAGRVSLQRLVQNQSINGRLRPQRGPEVPKDVRIVSDPALLRLILRSNPPLAMTGKWFEAQVNLCQKTRYPCWKIRNFYVHRSEIRYD